MCSIYGTGNINASERELHRLLELPEALRDFQRFALVEVLASVDDEREELRVPPHIHGDAGIDERNERVVALVDPLAFAAGREDGRLSVRAETERFCDGLEVALDDGLVGSDRVETFDKKALPDDVGSDVLHVLPLRHPRLGPVLVPHEVL